MRVRITSPPTSVPRTSMPPSPERPVTITSWNPSEPRRRPIRFSNSEGDRFGGDSPVHLERQPDHPPWVANEALGLATGTPTIDLDADLSIEGRRGRLAAS